MRHAMTTAAFALSILCAATALAKEPGSPERGQPGAQPAKPTPPAHARGDEKPGKPDHAATPERGKSAEAHAAAPGQEKRDDVAKERGEKPTEAAKDDKQAERRQTRDLRKKAHRQKLLDRLGADVLQRPAIVAELKTHAWRMARLERLRTLAEGLEAAKRAKTIERIDKLIDREKNRHDRQLEQLKSGAPPNPEKQAEKTGGGK